LVDLFVKADPDNNWVRVPVVNYLRACPLPTAKKALEKLEAIDPESVRRANTFFSIPVPSRETGKSDSSSSVDRDTEGKFSGGAAFPDRDENELGMNERSVFAQPGQATAALSLAAPSLGDLSPATLGSTTLTPTPVLQEGMNPWRLGYVLGLALATIMIVQFLLLSGGTQPAKG